MSNIRFVFFGTPYYVIPILDELNKRFKGTRGESPIAAVVTQPPKPAERQKILTYSEVDHWAHKRNIPIFFNSLDLIKEQIHADLGVLASYGNILPKEIVNYFPHGILVIHPSLLPEFRWGSPVPAAIATGTNPTGVTIIRMDELFDHGPVVSRFKEEVRKDDTCASLRDRLFLLSAPVLTELVEPYLHGKINLKAQDHTKATFSRTIGKEDSFIPETILEKVMAGSTPRNLWEMKFITNSNGEYFRAKASAETIERFIRAMTPWPGAFTRIKLSSKGDTKLLRLKILKAHLETNSHPKSEIHKQILVPDLVQLEGKNPVSWKQFKEAYSKAIL